MGPEIDILSVTEQRRGAKVNGITERKRYGPFMRYISEFDKYSLRESKGVTIPDSTACANKTSLRSNSDPIRVERHRT